MLGILYKTALGRRDKLYINPVNYYNMKMDEINSRVKEKLQFVNHNNEVFNSNISSVDTLGLDSSNVKFEDVLKYVTENKNVSLTSTNNSLQSKDVLEMIKPFVGSDIALAMGMDGGSLGIDIGQADITKNAIEYYTLVSKLTGAENSVTKNNGVSSGYVGTKSGSIIVDKAQRYLGTPYVWGGESMAEGGMDCSGFVYNALKDAGYKVGRTTAQGYRNYGKVVSKANMQPGDLVFFGNNNNANHIGIYLGNGKMIHSSGGSKNTKSNPGKGVSIINVDYRSDFIEARRY